MKTKLELTWIGKNDRPKLEPRILLEDTERSYHSSVKYSDSDIYDNILIYGDNLLALKALEQEYTGKIKCIYIDPPYNTGSAFDHYNDNLEHSIWLSMMRDRIELLHSLLRDDGSLWVSIDADECHYLKVVCDKVFGRKNFIDEVIWQRAYAPINLKKTLSRSHDNILVFAKNRENILLNKLPRTDDQNKDYKNPDGDPRGPWKVGNPSVGPAVSKNIYEVITPSGRSTFPPAGRSWLYSKRRLEELLTDNRIWFGRNGDNVWAPKIFLSEVKQGVTPMTFWSYKEVGHNQDAKKEVKAFNDIDVFATPKPERLLHRILTIASNPGDTILDSFLGSGTTAAVAHKMGRKWIGIELGEHCHTHCIPRLQKVISGEDQGGISKQVGWKGGGGFRYYKLAPSLLEKDRWGNWVISKNYKKEMLAEAICKLEGFKYRPSDTLYWQHGYSTENDFIYVTTQNLSFEQIQLLSEDVGSSRSLLVMCMAYRCKEEQFSNLTLKKIPSAVLSRCEWGKDDYSLNVENLPMKNSLDRLSENSQQIELFSEEEI